LFSGLGSRQRDSAAGLGFLIHLAKCSLNFGNFFQVFGFSIDYDTECHGCHRLEIAGGFGTCELPAE